MSTTEVEYMVVVEATNEALWLTGLVKELGVEKDGVQLHYNIKCYLFDERSSVSC